jgi:hypothetical protein
VSLATCPELQLNQRLLHQPPELLPEKPTLQNVGSSDFVPHLAVLILESSLQFIAVSSESGIRSFLPELMTLESATANFPVALDWPQHVHSALNLTEIFVTWENRK